MTSDINESIVPLTSAQKAAATRAEKKRLAEQQENAEQIAAFKLWVETETTPPAPRDPASDEVGGMWCCGGHIEAFWLYRAKSQTWSVEIANCRSAIKPKLSNAEWTLEALPPPPLPESSALPVITPSFWFEDQNFCWILPEGATRWQLARVQVAHDPFGKATHLPGEAVERGKPFSGDVY